MKKMISFLFCFMFICSFLMSSETVQNVLSPEEKAEGFQLLFDGQQLSPEIWQSAINGYPIEDGVVVCRKGGNLLTAKEYSDFVLRFEFALPPGGNNGVGIRAESASKDPAYHGMEIQILDNGAEKWKGLKPYQFHGSIYGAVPVKRNAEKNDYHKPVGEWNVEEITASGSKIKVVLNGETILDTDISEFKNKPTPDGQNHPGLLREKGFLGFLGHGDPVRFRNIRIKELNVLTEQEKKEGFELLFDGKTLSPEIWKNGIDGYWKNGINGYPVENGEMVCRNGGRLATNKEYGDFDFRFEFLLPPGGNSGILVRGSTEIQILDHFHERYKDLKPYQFHGSIYYSVPSKRVPEKNDFHKPVGEWNYEEIIVRGTQYKVILNNETILETDVAELKDKPSMDGKKHPELQKTKGALGFLGHGDPVRFRNIRVKEVNDSVQKTPQKTLQQTLPFFALCMDTHDEKRRTIEQQNEMLSQLGFNGVAHLWLKGLPERVASAKKYSLNVTQVYLRVDLAANPPYDQNLSKVLPSLKGQGTQLALLIYGGKPSDNSRDEKVIEIINRIDEIAKQSEVQVVLYPHVGAWLEKVGDAVRIAEKFNAQYPNRNVGVMFNLCHWAAVDKSENLEQILTLAKPYLKSITINGTDTPEEIQSKKGNWLQPLDSGSFNIATLLGLLKKIDYQGPVGLQCYGISGDAQEHLTRSMKTWRLLNGL